MSKSKTPVPDTFTPNTRPVQDSLKELAVELAYNYFSNSFGDDYNLDIAEESNIFNNMKGPDKFLKRLRKERVRNVMIIGAGVSADTYKAIPVGLGLVEEMKERFEKPIKTISFLAEKFTEQENEIKDITNDTRLNFENYLYLLK